MTFFRNLLRYNYADAPEEVTIALSYQVFIHGNEIEEWLADYEGSDLEPMLKTFLLLITVYHEKIN